MSFIKGGPRQPKRWTQIHQQQTWDRLRLSPWVMPTHPIRLHRNQMPQTSLQLQPRACCTPAAFRVVRAVLMFLGFLHFHQRLGGAGLQEEQSPLPLDRDSLSTNLSKISSGLLFSTNLNDNTSLVPWKLNAEEGLSTLQNWVLCIFLEIFFFFQVSAISNPNLFNLPPILLRQKSNTKALGCSSEAAKPL